MNASSCYWSYIDFYTMITYILTYTYNSEKAVGAEFISSRQRFLKILCKFHRKAPVLEPLFYKVASLQAWNVTKNRLLHKGFPVKFEKFWRTPILKNIWTTASMYWLLIIYLFLQPLTVHVLHFYRELLLYYAIKTIELTTREAVSFEEIFHWTKFLA